MQIYWYILQYKTKLGKQSTWLVHYFLDIVLYGLFIFWLTVLTSAVRNLHTLEWLDLTACSLTAQGAASTAALIKVQPCFIFAKIARSTSLVCKPHCLYQVEIGSILKHVQERVGWIYVPSNLIHILGKYFLFVPGKLTCAYFPLKLHV